MGPLGPGFVAPFRFRRFAEGRVVSVKQVSQVSKKSKQCRIEKNRKVGKFNAQNPTLYLRNV